MIFRRRRGQVWVETVIYTLIGLALIGLVLGFVTPRLDSAKDNAVVEQSISSLGDLDGKINEVLQAPGNVRQIDFTMKKGELFFNKVGENKIEFVLTGLKKPFSEPESEINFGKVTLVSQEDQKTNSVVLTLDYSVRNKIDLKYEDLDEEKKFTQSGTPYKFEITNKGVDDGPGGSGLVIVNVEEVSGR
jgi:hypothetical protein